MYKIIITAKPAGHALLYERLGRSGRRKRVRAYEAIVSMPDGTQHSFMFTRDVSDIVFGGLRQHFGVGGECPPNRIDLPYTGVLHRSANIPFAIKLFDQPDQTLLGAGVVVRRNLLIHHGPARSEGCFTIAGGKRHFKRFRRLLEPILHRGVHIEVVVEPRDK
ncbi:MAG: hypothetical protein KC877_04330 [Candidatus Kaiserbacteria bacterium]|nr:hypothetical protein [Candidatus Kaiserbacteria bacterium]MCB9816715.1 hypothetical protein [Candidatus Nomurabacteria bacterium]